jgi:hypothetical protein
MKMELYKTKPLGIAGSHLPLGSIFSFDFGPIGNHIGTNVPIIVGFKGIINADWLIALVGRRLNFRPIY